jgi:hypothetical protein
MHIAAHPVLRTEKGHKLHLRGFEKDINRGTETAVSPARVSHQSDTFAGKLYESPVTQHLNARLHDRFSPI